MNIYNNIIGIMLISIYFITFKNIGFQNLYTFSDIAYYLLVINFFISNPYFNALVITLIIDTLIGKIFILKKYSIQNIEDFILHYIPFLVVLLKFIFEKKENFKIDNNIIILLIFGYLIISCLYREIYNEPVYPRINLKTLSGIVNFIIASILILLTYNLLNYINNKIKY